MGKQMESNEKLKAIEIEMLKALAEACEKLGIKYYIIGGTLLGAVRHKGFIPWDDDIDVGIMREEYEVFKKLGQAVLPECYFVQTNATDPEYRMNFIKIRDSRTTFIETAVRNYNINHGIYIDVFPLDYYPEKKAAVLWLKFRKKIIHFRKRLEHVRHEKVHGPWLKEKIANAIGIMTKIIYPTVGSALEAWDNICGGQKPSSLIINNAGLWGDREIVRTEWFGEGVELEFEGLKVRAPVEYDKWLRNVYGDYMQLPPEDERVTHHYAEVIDTEKPYTEYVKRGQQK